MIHGISEKVIDQIKHLAQKYDVDRVVLFGSRARGDHYRTSDIDLATWGGNYALFAIDVDDETDTLLKYDIINMLGNVNKELVDQISKEGICIYEKVQ